MTFFFLFISIAAEICVFTLNKNFSFLSLWMTEFHLLFCQLTYLLPIAFTVQRRKKGNSMSWNLIIEINKNMISESDILSTLFSPHSLLAAAGSGELLWFGMQRKNSSLFIYAIHFSLSFPSQKGKMKNSKDMKKDASVITWNVSYILRSRER